MLQRATEATAIGWADDAGLRRNNFDFFRFALAGAVVLSHSCALVGRAEPLSAVTNGQIDLGKVAVDCFFIISGFLITHSWRRSRGAWDYFWKRIVRIYPAFAAAVVFGALIVPQLAPSASSHTGMAARDYIRMVPNILNLRGYGPDGVFATNPVQAINGSLWSIRYEFWCYVGVAAVGIIGWMRRPGWLLATLGGALTISVLFEVFKWTPGGKIVGTIVGYPPLWARLLPYYLAGMVFYLFRTNIPYSASLAVAAAVGLVAGALIPHGLAVAMPTAGAYLLLYLAFRPIRPLANWSKWGDFSYGMYLYAFPLQQLIVAHMGARMSPLVLFAWSLPASVAAGVVSWYAVERWFLYLKRRKPKDPERERTPDAMATVAG